MQFLKNFENNFQSIDSFKTFIKITQNKGTETIVAHLRFIKKLGVLTFVGIEKVQPPMLRTTLNLTDSNPLFKKIFNFRFHPHSSLASSPDKQFLENLKLGNKCFENTIILFLSNLQRIN